MTESIFEKKKIRMLSLYIYNLHFKPFQAPPPPYRKWLGGGGGLRHKGKRDTNILFLFISSVPSWPFLRLKSNESNELIEISFQLRITPLEITKTIQKGYRCVAKLSYLNWICQKFRRIRYPMPQKLIKLPHMIIV